MHFEKVSYEQWKKDCFKVLTDIDKVSEQSLVDAYNNIKLPKQGTRGSMGMDFFAPFNFTIHGHCSIIIPTGIRWVVDEQNLNKGLCIYPRSGLGFKTGMHLANTVGVIDSTYQYSDNEGHILIKLIDPRGESIYIEEGKGFCQGIITEYFICDGAESDVERNGGFGSTDK